MNIKKFNWKLLAAFFTICTTTLLLDWHFFWNTAACSEEQMPKIISVAKGDSLSKVSNKLVESQLFSRPLYLKIYLRYQNLFQYFKYGDYSIHPQQTPTEILKQLQKGKVQTYGITIIPGTNWSKLYEDLSQNPLIVNDLTSLTKQKEFCSKHQIHTLEGWFAPDTYKVSKYTKLSDFLTLAIERQKYLLEQITQTHPCSLSFDQALILASIIEKESSYQPEYSLISSAYHNRLAQNMRLQSDPTVLYGMNLKNKRTLTYSDLKNEHQHNTYKHSGLPPTAIAYPSKHAMIAACFPASTDYLFFVAKKDSSRHIFSKNFKDHVDVRRSQKYSQSQ